MVLLKKKWFEAVCRKFINDQKNLLEFIVIHFNPISIGILQINLADAVGSHLWFSFSLPVLVFYSRLIKMFYKIRN